MSLEALVAQWGLPALFLGAGLEGETSAVVGGVLAHRRLFPLSEAIATAAAGAFVADQLLFTIGRRFHGHPRVEALLARPSAQRAVQLIARHPVALVMGFRFVVGFRTVSPIAMGATRVGRLRFLLLDLVAAIVWASCFVLAGFGAGGLSLAILGKELSHHIIRVGLAAMAVAVPFAIWRVFRRFRHAQS